LANWNSTVGVSTKTYKKLYEIAVERITLACSLTFNNIMSSSTYSTYPNPNTYPYTATGTYVPTAPNNNKIACFIWQQGENEAALINSINATVYGSCLTALIDAFRGQTYSGVSATNVPWVIGGFTDWTVATTASYPAANAINSYLSTYGTSGSPKPFTGFASAYQVPYQGNNGGVHFTFDGYRIMGLKLIVAYQYALTNGSVSPVTTLAAPTVSYGTYNAANNSIQITLTMASSGNTGGTPTSFQWQSSTTLNGSYTNISGATTNPYTLIYNPLYTNLDPYVQYYKLQGQNASNTGGAITSAAGASVSIPKSTYTPTVGTLSIVGSSTTTIGTIKLSAASNYVGTESATVSITSNSVSVYSGSLIINK